MTTEYTIDIINQRENTVRFCLKRGEHHLKFNEVFDLWEHNADFVNFYKNELIKFNYPAFYWEHPALNKAFLEKKYECIVQKSRPLEHLAINEGAFSDYIFNEEEVADFMNLGKNARLVIPTKKSEHEIYNHLGKFIRLAEAQQITAVFKQVGKTIIEELEKQEVVWLNTAGLGVIWLHIRMDTRPKYYKTKEYKNPEFLERIS